jgi:hypothetical protein
MAHDHLPPAQRPPERAGYDALHGWDTSIDAEPEEVASDPLGGDLLEEADVGVEWGPEGALARALISAALTDVAPGPLRERVLLAVDNVLREPVAVPAFPADAAPVTTLSGVFEKRRPTTESASCIEASPADAVGAVERHTVLTTREVASPEAVASPQQAPVGSGACTLEGAALQLAALSACLLESDDKEGVSLESAPVEGASASGVHCCGGPMMGGRCRNTSRAVGFAASPVTSSPVTSSPVTSSPVTSSPVTSSPVTSSRMVLNPMATPLRSGPFRAGVDGGAVSDAARATLGSGSASTGLRLDAGAVLPARDVAVASNLDVPLTAIPLGVAERSTSARLRDGVMVSAFNLAQLAAAIVVGIVIGKAAHLIMAEERATAWNPTAESEGGLRAEPSRIPDSARAREPLEVTEALDSIEPRRTQRAPRTRAGSAARAPSRPPGSGRPVRAAHARPAAACTLASAQVASATALPATVSPATVAPLAAALGCPPVARVGGSWVPQPTNLAAVAPSRRAPLEVGQRSGLAAADLVSPPQPSSDDWLGEQLAILGQAQRSLLEDDPESAVRSLEVYEARFPDGLLDPQMASIRQRVEERFTAFIFP